MTIKEIADYGAMFFCFFIFIKYVMNLFDNKNKQEKDQIDMNNFQNTEMFNLIKSQIEQNIEMNKSYKIELTEIKKLILNSSNMNTEDFEVFMKTMYSNIVLELEKEMFCIIERNHIDEHTLSLTQKKVENLVEKIINNHIYIMQSLNFDNSTIRSVVNFNVQEKEQIKMMMKEIITSYSCSDSSYKKEDAKRQVEENVKYIYNAYESHLYQVLETIHNL